jgi:hypothetical protein
VQAERRRLQALDDVVQRVVRLLRRQLQHHGHLQDGQCRCPTVHQRGLRCRRSGVRVERRLLQWAALCPEHGKRASLRMRVRELRPELRELYRQRGLLRRTVQRRARKHDGSVRALRHPDVRTQNMPAAEHHVRTGRRRMRRPTRMRVVRGPADVRRRGCARSVRRTRRGRLHAEDVSAAEHQLRAGR